MRKIRKRAIIRSLSKEYGKNLYSKGFWSFAFFNFMNIKNNDK